MKFLLLNLPEPEGYIIQRDWAGALGTASKKREGSNERFFPIAFVYAASALLKNRADFSFIDAQGSELNHEEATKRVLLEKPDVIIAMLSLPSLDYELKFLRNIKEWLPNIKIICIGAVGLTMAEKILEHKIDVVVQGRYPYYNSLFKIVYALKRNSGYKKAPGISYMDGGKQVKNPPEDENDLNEIDFRAYELFDLKKYHTCSLDSDGNPVSSFAILTAVGCPFNCMYCAYPMSFGRRIFYKPMDKIIDEIEYLIKNFGIDAFAVRDIVFGANREQMSEFCTRVSCLKIKFVFETRADLIDEAMLKELKKAGCFKINFGVETGNPEILKTSGKPGLDVEKLKAAFRLTRKHGIANMAHLIIGLPGETKETINDTLKLLRELNPDGINLNYATPYPGTGLYDLAKSKKWVLHENFLDYTSHDVVMRNDGLSAEEIKKYGHNLKLRFTLFKAARDSSYRSMIFKKMLQKIGFRK